MVSCLPDQSSRPLYETMNESPQPSVIVVGGGAFGTSTAYHLAQRRYCNVKVLDRFAAPSKEAAANDLNKIIRYDYPNSLYTKLSLEAMDVWKHPSGFLSGLFRPSGWIMAAQELTQSFLKSSHQSSRERGNGSEFITIEETKRRWPVFTGSFTGWTNLWSPEAGWVGTPWSRINTRLMQAGSIRSSSSPYG